MQRSQYHYIATNERNVCTAEFEKAGIDLSKPLVVSCGSAMVAGMVAFTGHLLGKEVAVYDVSCYGNQYISVIVAELGFIIQHDTVQARCDTLV